MRSEEIFDYDPQIAGDFATRTELAFQAAHAQLASELPYLPAFGYRSPPPDDPDLDFAPTLQYHLQQLNAMESAETTPDLSPSATTNMPVIGRIWGQARQELHQSILFYVNRLQRSQTQQNTHIVNTINELTRVIAEQQATIGRLEREIEQLKYDE